MQDEPRYLLIDTRVLPDVFLRVAQAKRLLASKEVKNATEAAKAVGISRSALYKYKDFIFTRTDEDSGRAPKAPVVCWLQKNHSVAAKP